MIILLTRTDGGDKQTHTNRLVDRQQDEIHTSKQTLKFVLRLNTGREKETHTHRNKQTHAIMDAHAHKTRRDPNYISVGLDV